MVAENAGATVEERPFKGRAKEGDDRWGFSP